MLFSRSKTEMVTAERALHGRGTYAFALPRAHFVSGRSIQPPFPEGMIVSTFALGCFWGAEREFWQMPGVWTTAAGYSGGYTPYPTYEEVCSGLTGHAEVVLVVSDPEVISYETLLSRFFEAHDPTQGMRQGNDIGSQYRSAVYSVNDAERAAAEAAKAAYSQRLQAAGRDPVTSEITQVGPFYYAEDYHQQYLAKNPDGYCGLGGTGVACPVGLFAPGKAAGEA